MAKYMLLLHDEPQAFAKISPEDMQKVVQKYIAWGKSLRERGIHKGSDKLTDEPGRVMRLKTGEVRVTDGRDNEEKQPDVLLAWTPAS